MKHGIARLAAVFARLLDNPRTPAQMEARWQEVLCAEQELELRQQVAQAERADVEQLANPVRRVLLLLTGALHEIEVREQAEYDQALGQVLETGARVHRLREAFEALPPFPAVDDARVADAFNGVERADLAWFGSLEADLAPLWTRAHRVQRLVALRQRCHDWRELTPAADPEGTHRKWLETEVREALLALGLDQLEERLATDLHRRTLRERTARKLALAVDRHAADEREGLALATLDVLRGQVIHIA